VQRRHGLLDRRARIEAVDLVEVDVIDAEPRQAGIDGGEDALARQPARVRALGRLGAGRIAALEGKVDRKVELGGDDDLIARRVAPAGAR
jgi:hypothetical protein